MKQQKNKKEHRTWYRSRLLWWPVGILVGFGILLAIAMRFTPWPGALIIRTVFNQGGGKTLAAMEATLPDYPVHVTKDLQYKAGDRDAYLDIYVPKSAVGTKQELPIIVWTHGGAWLSGDKKSATPYYERLANQGFVVIAVNYSLAPGKTYPTAIHQLNSAHAYISKHAKAHNGDPEQVVLAGDSAGAQLSSQMAALITNADYAQSMHITPSLKASQLIGVMLYCGIYKMESLAEPQPDLAKLVSWGDSTSVWALTGTRDKASPAIRQMSAYYHVSEMFPPTFISGGNADPLTKVQSMPFAEKLTSLGTRVDTLFYADDHTPGLPHEYQFTFNADGEKAFETMLAFLRQTTRQ